MLRGMIVELITYIISYFLFVLFVVLIAKKMKNKKLAAFIIIVALIVYASIRYNVGSDYDTYYKQFDELPRYFNDAGRIISSDVQHGLTLMMFFIRKISTNPIIFFFIHALLIYPITIRYIREESKDFSWSIFLYFALQFHMVSLNLMKQVVSMTIFLYNKENIVKNRLIRCVLLSALMIVFHVSSILPICIMFISKYIKPTLKKYYITIIISIILLFLYKQLLPHLDFALRYLPYLDNINYDYYIVTIGAIGYLLVHLFILYRLLRKKDELISINPDNKVLLSALILAIPFKVLAIDNFPIYRLSLYIDQFLLFIIPNYLSIRRKEMSDSSYKKYVLSIVILLICFFVFEIIFIPHNNFYSYQTIFNIGR